MPEVHKILSCYPRDCQPGQIEPLGSAGGMSGAQFWRIVAPWGELMLRRWPAEHPSPQKLPFMHAVLRHAQQHGIACLSVPVGALDGRSFVEHGGHLWELAPWLPGAADFRQTPSEAKLRAAMRTLAGFHIAVADFDASAGGRRIGYQFSSAAIPENAPAPSVRRQLALLRDLRTGGIPSLARAIRSDHWPELVPFAREFVSLLPAAVQRVTMLLEPLASEPLPLQVCLRDVWHDHVLFTREEVTGLIDFGAVDVDTPAVDVARLLGSFVGDDPHGWQTGLAAYSQVRPLTEKEIRAAHALDRSGTLLAGCNWIRWIYVAGRQFENCEQVTERFRSVLTRMVALCST